MRYRVEVTRTARQEIRGVYNWMRDRAPEAAELWIGNLERALETLHEHPYRCRVAPESQDLRRELRQLLYGRRRGVYRVIFYIDEAEVCVHVLHVRHAAMEWLRPEDVHYETDG